ncbi:TPA: phage tail protein, partial [Acinetobacter baumannii]
HHTYKLGEDWEIGAKYTLIWCAEHKRGTGDNNSYLAVYAGGGSQTLQSIVNTDGKVISKVTFVKNSAVASGPIIHFYMINRPTADKGTIGTVYWAVLVKGDVLTTDAWIPSTYDYIPDSNANASAITNLTNTVTQQGNTLTSHTNSITSLNNSITTINGTLSSKADSSALNSLANRVSTAEGAISSQGSSITSLNSSVTGILKDIEVTDSRSTNQPPSWYWSNYPKRIVREFKRASTIGLSGMGTYVSLETYVYYSDATGGPIIQIARGTNSKLTAERRSTSTSTWSTWTQDIKAISDGLANKAEASALSSLDSKVSVIDGKVSTQASSITTLQTTVGGNTASIQSQQQSIDGLKARATLKLQSGNLVGGVGIENDSKTVDFIIQANKFAIGAPSTVSGSVTPKYAFVYQSTATTLPNGTVIPAGLYLDSASISYINANKIYADSLSAISANLGTFTSLADQSKPNGARTVISGERIEVYDENNVMRVRIGRW